MLKDITYVAAFLTFGVFSLIGFNIYHNQQLSTVPEETAVKTDSIIPSFDIETLNSLSSRNVISANIGERLNTGSSGSQEASKSGTLNQEEVEKTSDQSQVTQDL